MKRGSLIIYDNDGKVWHNSGDAMGDIIGHKVPNGLPYIVTKYGELDHKTVLKVDVKTKTLITEDIPVRPTYEELENQILLGKEGLL